MAAISKGVEINNLKLQIEDFDLRKRHKLTRTLESLAQKYGVEKAVAHIVGLGIKDQNEGYIAYLLNDQIPDGPNMVASIALDKIQPGFAFTRLSQVNGYFMACGSETALMNPEAPGIIEDVYRVLNLTRAANKESLDIILEPGSANHASVYAGNSKADNWNRVIAKRAITSKDSRQPAYYATNAIYLPAKQTIALSHNIGGGTELTLSEPSLTDLWSGADSRKGETYDRPTRYGFAGMRLATFGRLIDDSMAIGLRPVHDQLLSNTFKTQDIVLGSAALDNHERFEQGSEMQKTLGLSFGSPLGMPNQVVAYRIHEDNQRFMMILPADAFFSGN